METDKHIFSDIEQIFNSFDRFVNMCELDDWLNKITIEDIKISFKLASFVEEAIKNVQLKNCEARFKNVLDSWWKSKNRTQVYDVNFFSVACDHLLLKYFAQDLSINTLDVAVRIYTTTHPRERFELLISKFLLHTASFEAIIQYAAAAKNDLDIIELKSRLILRNWATEIKCGRIDKIETNISNMLLNFKIESCLPILITVLTVKNTSEEDTIVKDIILETLLSKMIDRSVLSKQFWLVLFKQVDKQRLGAVCFTYKNFLKDLFDFIMYLGSIMNYKYHNFERKWISDPSVSICPEITYEELRDLIKYLYDYDNQIRNYVEERVLEAENLIRSEFWQQFRREL